MSFEQTKWVWMNGRMVRWDEATLHVSAHTLHYGSGVFEGLRCYETEGGAAVFRVNAHLDRLFASAEVYGLRVPYSREELTEAICETVRRNDFKGCYVRLICYFGAGTLGLDTRKCPTEFAILAWPWAAYLGAEGLEAGVRVTVSSWAKFSSRMMPTTAKACGQYLNSLLATREAISRGFDEALLLDAEGNIAEGPGENLFLVREGRLLTNDERSSILLGVTRESVLEIARDLRYETVVGTLRLDDLLAADEAFFTGTAVEVMPIREVDGRPLGGGARGPVTRKIQQVFFDATAARAPRYRSWLHPVAAR